MKIRRSTRIMLALAVLMIAVNIAARFFPAAVDVYIQRIFPYYPGIWSRFTGLFPFSVGEWMIVAGIVLLVIALPLYLILMLIFRHDNDKKTVAASWYGRFYGWVLTLVLCVVTMRFTVLYRGTQLSKTIGHTEYSDAQVLEVVSALVDQANALSPQVARDESGFFAMTDDLMPEAKACMTRLSEEYPQFRGYYPDAKPIHHAYFFSQQNLLGIYFPHSMEAIYNPVVYSVNLPCTVCHEYTHLKGNIFEDEAGYYAYLACMTSDSPDFRYSATISALEWFTPEFGDPAAWEQYTQILDTLDPGVQQDMYRFIPEEYWEEHKDEEVIPTAIVSDTADAVMDASLKVNGIPEGTGSYSGMTLLLLHHYLDEN